MKPPCLKAKIVMAGLVPAIHERKRVSATETQVVCARTRATSVDAPHKAGHDAFLFAGISVAA
jgi:hypothetical protein